MKNANQKLMQLNEENTTKIKELNNRLENNNHNNSNENENDNNNNNEYGFKKLISVMNIETKEENEENENSNKNFLEMAKHRDKKNPTARFGGGYSNDNGNGKIFMFEGDNEDE